MSDGFGPCLAFPGEKLIIKWFHGYLVCVSRRGDIGAGTAVKSPVSGSDGSDMHLLTIYDVRNRFVGMLLFGRRFSCTMTYQLCFFFSIPAYSAPIHDIRHIFCEWGSVFAVSGEDTVIKSTEGDIRSAYFTPLLRQIFELREKDLGEKLDVLFKKSQYSLAITLARRHNYDELGVVDIRRQYGDHLYSQGNFVDAVSQYKETIGHLEPSYVIRKFLDAQRIQNLTAYLEALHERKAASEDHTTLLLNCYTKLKDAERLERFILSRNTERAV